MSVAIFHHLECLHDASELARLLGPIERIRREPLAGISSGVEKLTRWCARS